MPGFEEFLDAASLVGNELFQLVEKSPNGNAKCNHNCKIENLERKHIYQTIIRTLAKSYQQSEQKFRHLFRNLPIAFAYHKIISNNMGHTDGYVFVEVNETFEDLIGVKRKDIIGTCSIELLPNIYSFQNDWLQIFEKVVSTGEKIRFEQYFESLERWISVTIYQAERERIVTLFSDITDYKQAEETIKNQHDFLEKIKDSLTHPFYVIDVSDFSVLMANQSSNFGSLEENPTCYALTHGRDMPCTGSYHPCPIKEIRREKKPVSLNHIHIDDSGNSRLMEIHAYPIFNSDGDVTKVIEYTQDITDRYQTELALKKSEERYRTLIQSINDRIFVIDSENRFSQYYSSSELTPNEFQQDIIGKNIIEIFPPQISQLYTDASEEVRKTGKRQSVEYSLENDEKKKWFFATLDQHEDRDSIVGMIRDVTKQKQIEDALRKSETRLADAQRLAHLGCWEFDITKEEVKWSDEMFNIFGRSRNDVVKTLDEFLDLVHPNDMEFVRTSVERIMETGESISMDYRVSRSDGSECFVHEQCQGVSNEKGDVVRLVGIVQDITPRKIVENQLQTASRKASLYLDLMGHDIVNQLQIILSCNAILGEKLKLMDNRYLLEMIQDSVMECERIVSKIRSTEKLATTPLVNRDLIPIIIDCIDALREEGMDIYFSRFVEKASILADEFLEYLIDNLLENALKHNTSANPKIWIYVQEKNQGFEVSISDNGQGIRDRMKENLFDPTRRFGGVGLHQVKDILDKYSGVVTVHDRILGSPDSGVEFRIWLPKIKQEQLM